jgi:hypothetical protein
VADIAVNVHNDRDRNSLLFTWERDRKSRGHYNVDKGLIRERGCAVRSALKELVIGRREKKADRYPDLLRDVAKKGHNLEPLAEMRK